MSQGAYIHISISKNVYPHIYIYVCQCATQRGTLLAQKHSHCLHLGRLELGVERQLQLLHSAVRPEKDALGIGHWIGDDDAVECELVAVHALLYDLRYHHEEEVTAPAPRRSATTSTIGSAMTQHLTGSLRANRTCDFAFLVGGFALVSVFAAS